MLTDDRTEPLTINIVYTHTSGDEADRYREAELAHARRKSPNGEVDAKTMRAIVDKHRYEDGR
jgi:hypothetical protein